MMSFSNAAWGGCDNLRLDCTGTDVDHLLGFYDAHNHKKNHPPEGSWKTLHYIQSCVKHQCRGGPPPSGAPSWTPGRSVSRWTSVANPCGTGGCQRLFSDFV